MNSGQSTAALSIDTPNIQKASKVFRAFNHKLRQKILRLIDEKGRITVTSIYVALRLEQSVASQHLAILRTAGFVNTEREGRFIFYSVNYQKIKQINQIAEQLITKVVPQLQ